MRIFLNIVSKRHYSNVLILLDFTVLHLLQSLQIADFIILFIELGTFKILVLSDLQPADDVEDLLGGYDFDLSRFYRTLNAIII